MRRGSVGLALLLAACGSSEEASSGAAPKTDAEYREQVLTGMHELMLGDIDTLGTAAQDIQAAAPTTRGRGWDAAADAQAIEGMRDAWKRARTAYERIEAAIAPLFPDIDHAIDARYDDFLQELGPGGDPDPFDGQGVTGMHAVERILWADSAPARVVEFEQTLPGYVPALFPANEGEAQQFKDGLCQELLADVTRLHDQWQPTEIHIAIAFQGLVSLMNEQREKVSKAASNEEESRYAERTMVDIRDNLEGTKAAYELFRPWLLSKKNADPTRDGAAIDAKIAAGFAKLAAAYRAVPGDAFPVPPPTWSSENPSAADLSTPFGALYSEVTSAVDPNDPSSVVAQMNDAAAALGFPVYGR